MVVEQRVVKSYAFLLALAFPPWLAAARLSLDNAASPFLTFPLPPRRRL